MGKLQITIVECKQLQKLGVEDCYGKTDPYVRLKMGPNQEYQTISKDDTNNPVFNATTQFEVPTVEMPTEAPCEKEIAVRKIQNAERQRQAKEGVSSRKAQAQKSDAATKLQCAERQRQAKDDVSSRKTQAQKSDAATKLQCAERQRQATEDVGSRKTQAQKSDAATKLQCAERQRQAKDDVVSRKIQAQKSDAATKLQCAERQRQATENVGSRKTQAQKSDAATKLQCAERQRQAKDDVHKKQTATAAAVKIQCAERQRLAKMHVQAQRRARSQEPEDLAATRIQCAERRRQAKLDVETKRMNKKNSSSPLVAAESENDAKDEETKSKSEEGEETKSKSDESEKDEETKSKSENDAKETKSKSEEGEARRQSTDVVDATPSPSAPPKVIISPSKKAKPAPYFSAPRCVMNKAEKNYHYFTVEVFDSDFFCDDKIGETKVCLLDLVQGKTYRVVKTLRKAGGGPGEGKEENNFSFGFSDANMQKEEVGAQIVLEITALDFGKADEKREKIKSDQHLSIWAVTKLQLWFRGARAKILRQEAEMLRQELEEEQEEQEIEDLQMVDRTRASSQIQRLGRALVIRKELRYWQICHPLEKAPTFASCLQSVSRTVFHAPKRGNTSQPCQCNEMQIAKEKTQIALLKPMSFMTDYTQTLPFKKSALRRQKLDSLQQSPLGSPSTANGGSPMKSEKETVDWSTSPFQLRHLDLQRPTTRASSVVASSVSSTASREPSLSSSTALIVGSSGVVRATRKQRQELQQKFYYPQGEDEEGMTNVDKKITTTRDFFFSPVAKKNKGGGTPEPTSHASVDVLYALGPRGLKHLTRTELDMLDATVRERHHLATTRQKWH